MKCRITKDKNGYHAYVLEEINLNGFYYLQSIWTEIENKFFGQKYYDTEEEAIEACEHYQDKKDYGDGAKLVKEFELKKKINDEINIR